MKMHKWWEIAVSALLIGSFLASATPIASRAELQQKPGTTPRVIALTFDDGPSPRYTPDILHLLSRYHAHATFFVLGSEAAQYSKVLREIVKQGSVVANHGYTHVNYFQVGLSGVLHDAERTRALLQKEKIPMAPFYRPPYGNSNKRLIDAISRQGYTLTLWSIDTRDWMMPGTSAITRKVLTDAAPGAIVLMHDGGGNRTQTADALAAILPVLEAEGYRFVTLPQYMRDLGLPFQAKLPRPINPQTQKPAGPKNHPASFPSVL